MLTGFISNWNRPFSDAVKVTTMYREAEEAINQGLSPFARILLGSVSGLFGLMMIFIAPPTDKQVYFYLFGGFCLAISFACIFKGWVRQFLGSLIGLCLVIVSGWYLVSQLIQGGPLFSARSEQSLFNAVLFALFFGIPGLAYMLKARFGLSKKSS
jgi:hypothetical protein